MTNIFEVLKLDIITALLSFIAGIWFKSFLSSFFIEKGKHLAQKQDIAEITSKIESVKKDFNNDSEVLKNDLQRLLNFQVSHRSEERNAIIKFYDKYNQWMYSLLEINFGAYNRRIVKELAEKRIFIEKFYAETNVAQARLKLLVKDKKIIQLSHQLVFDILQFKTWFDNYLFGLQNNLERHNSLTDNFLIVIKNLEENKELANSIANQENNIEKERKKLVDDFYRNRNKEFNKINSADMLFTEIVKDYLTK